MSILPFTTDTSVQLPLAFNTNNSYDPVITSNNISSYSGWTKITGTNNVYNTNFGDVGIGIIPTAPFEIYKGTWKIKWGNYNPYTGCNKAYCNGPFRFYSVPLNTIITTFHDITNYDTPTTDTMRVSISTTGVYILNDLQVNGNIGFGVAPSALYKCNIAGSINSTSLYQSGTLIDFSSYATNTNLTTVSNNLQANIDTKLTIPTASTTLVGIGSNLTFLDYLNIKNPPILNYLQLTGGSITGNITTQQLYINNPDSTASIFFNPTASIYALFSKKPPWAMYFAEDYNIATPTILPNYISNGRDAVCSGTIAKTTLAGNGATGAITYISGSTVATIAFPDGSIPSQFTILALTRYNGGTRRRILQANGANWLHGHWSGTRGCTYYNDGWKSNGYTTNLDNWVCTIGKNVGATPGNMLIDGVPTGIASGGAGTLRLGVNYGSYGSGESSDWCLSCVMIWSEALTDAEMVDLNTIINNYKTSGTPIKTLLDTINDDECVIESRVYGGTEKTELLLFKGNDATGTNGADRIRLRAGNIAFDTYSSVTTNRNLENIVMLINENGNVGIGTTTNLTNKLNVNGITSSISFIGNGAALTNLAYANIDGKPTNFQADWNSTIINKPSTFPATMTYIYTKSETDTLLNTKQPNLTFTSPLTNTANNVSINLGQYSTTGNDGNYLLKTGGTITGTLNVNGIANIHNGSPFSVTYNYMQSGSLTIGGINANYGTGGNQFTTNTAGLMMECLDYTEIAVHDAGQRVASLMYYDGPANIIYIGRNKGWTITNTNIVGSATAASFIGVGSSLTSLDWNNITLNKPTTFAPTMTDIYTKSNVDTLLNAKQPTLTAATSLLGNGSAITSIAYANITGTPTMANYVLKAGDTMTGALTVSSSINISGATNAAQSLYFRSTDYNLGIAGGAGQYSSTALQNDMILRTLTNTNLILQSGNGGYGLKINTTNNISCSGTLTATSFIGIGSSLTTLDWNNITLNKPTTFAPTMTYIYTKSETDTLLLAKQPTLTFTSPLTNTANTVSINLGNYSTTGNDTNYLLKTGGTLTGTLTGTTINATTLNIANQNINNWLFNNTGANHATYTDFNSIDKFGYSFIQNSTNGPGTGATQFYSWYIGLGAEYPFANSTNGYYGMQFAVGRNETNPKLSIRRKENNVWSGWEGLTSEKAVSLTSGSKTISGALTISGELINQYWKFTNDSDYCRLNGVGGGYFNFAANALYANTSLQVNTTANINSTLTVGGMATSRHRASYAETLSYTVNYNGGTNSGWFWTTNSFWDVGGGTGGAYLTVYIKASGYSSEWYGRAYLASSGGSWGVVCDYRNPSGGFNAIDVVDFWGPNGANALKISLNSNYVYGGNFIIKVSG